MKSQTPPRLNSILGPVTSEGKNLVAKMGLELQQYLSLVGRDPKPTVLTVTVGASPFTYQNERDFDMDVIVSGGTVSQVAFSRDGVTFYPVASATNTTVRLNPGDSVRVTYSVLPTLVLVPR